MNSSTLISTQCIDILCNVFKIKNASITDNLVTSNRGYVRNHDNRILGHPQKVQSTITTARFGPVQKTHGKRPNWHICLFLTVQMFNSVNVKTICLQGVVGQQGPDLPLSRFLDVVCMHLVGTPRRVIDWSQDTVNTESYYLTYCLFLKSLQMCIITYNLHFTSICNVIKSKGSVLCFELSLISHLAINVSKPIKRINIDASDIDMEIHIEWNLLSCT
jgi:hypothetical protein